VGRDVTQIWTDDGRRF